MAKAIMAAEEGPRGPSTNIVARKIQATRQFYRDIKLEMKRVTWPTREEVVQTTAVTILVVCFFGYFLWGTNWALSKLVNLLINFLSN
jgi:preprotein translocase SecE subunit